MKRHLILPAQWISYAREISLGEEKDTTYFSICTLMTQPMEYQEMIESFLLAGFRPDTCEFLYINNTAAIQVDAFTGLNRLMQSAQGQYIILCHQDVLLNFDKRDALVSRIDELNRIDPSWAVFGNAGVDRNGTVHACISHPCKINTINDHLTEKFFAGKLPSRCDALDENFLVVKRSTKLRFSADLTGFHFYGTDICQIANALGFSAWVVDFHLLHKSRGRIKKDFYYSARNMEIKLKKRHRSEYLQTIIAKLYLGENSLKSRLSEYRLLHYMKKNGTIISIKEMFSGPVISLPFLWLLHRLIRPLENLQRTINKRKS